MQESGHQIIQAKQDEIASIAFILWQKAGQPSGRDLEFWLNAEQQIIAARQARADTQATSQSRLKTSSRSAMNSSSEPTGVVRSSPTGTNRSPEKNGGHPIAQSAIRPGQAPAKRATSGLANQCR